MKPIEESRRSLTYRSKALLPSIGRLSLVVMMSLWLIQPQAGGNLPATQSLLSITRASAAQGTLINPGQGGSLMDPSGAGIGIPRDTLKASTFVNLFPVDATSQMDNCGVQIQPRERFPDVPGFSRATLVIRYESQPCGSVGFGPGMNLTLPLLRPLSLRTPPLHLFELARSEAGELVFLDTGIVAKVEPGNTIGFGDRVIIPNIQIFGTFAAFLADNNKVATNMPGRGPVTAENPLFKAQPSRPDFLSFAIIDQQNGRQTRLSIANPESSADLNISFTAYGEAGQMVGMQSRTIEAQRQASFVVTDLFPGFTRGAIIARGQQGEMTGFSEIADGFPAGSRLCGVEGIQSLHQTLIFPVVRSLDGAFTEIHVFNSNAFPVSIRLAGFTATGRRVNPTNQSGQALAAVTLSPWAKLVVSSTTASSTGGAHLDFTQLDGGYIIVQTTDGQAIAGSEIFGEVIAGQLRLAMLNGVPFPVGCVESLEDQCACHVDMSPAAPIPNAGRQHTLYATHFEDEPAEAILYLVNVSDRPAPFSLTAFGDRGGFLETFPPQRSEAMIIEPHQVFQRPVRELFSRGRFTPNGYVRVEDPNSSFVGVLVNRMSSAYITAVPLVPDDPQMTQTATNTFFSRVQLDPASANPQQLTGLLIFNPNNNDLRFAITITDGDGSSRSAGNLRLGERATFLPSRQTLSTLFRGLNVSSGFVKVEAVDVPGPGQGGRLIPFVVYRSNSLVSAVPPQNKQPE